MLSPNSGSCQLMDAQQLMKQWLKIVSGLCACNTCMLSYLRQSCVKSCMQFQKEQVHQA